MDHEPTPAQCEKAAAQALRCIRDDLESEGIGGRYLAKKLKGELNAQEVKVFCNESTDGEVKYSKRLKAHDIIIKALDMSFKLRGDYPAEKREVTGNNGGPLTIKIIPPGGEEIEVKVDE